MKDAVGQYLDTIGQVPLLTADDERELAQAIEAGRDAARRLAAGERGVALRRAVERGEQARDHFIRANLRLVVHTAQRYRPPAGMEFLDLVQEGNLGLEHAVEKFDWRKGFKFSTYATWWIRQAIGRALNQKGSLVRLPDDRWLELRAARREVAEGEALDLDDELARIDRLVSPTSLDQPVGAEGEHELVDLVPDHTPGPEDLLTAAADERLVDELLGCLEPRQRLAVERRFGIFDGQRRTYREIGEELDLPTESVRRLIRRALARLEPEVAAVLAAA
jgi:RNA polymerase primary sigma factor